MRDDPYRFGREQALGGYDAGGANMAVSEDMVSKTARPLDQAGWFRSFWEGYYDQRRWREMRDLARDLEGRALDMETRMTNAMEREDERS